MTVHYRYIHIITYFSMVMDQGIIKFTKTGVIEWTQCRYEGYDYARVCYEWIY